MPKKGPLYPHVPKGQTESLVDERLDIKGQLLGVVLVVAMLKQSMEDEKLAWETYGARVREIEAISPRVDADTAAKLRSVIGVFNLVIKDEHDHHSQFADAARLLREV